MSTTEEPIYDCNNNECDNQEEVNESVSEISDLPNVDTVRKSVNEYYIKNQPRIDELNFKRMTDAYDAFVNICIKNASSENILEAANSGRQKICVLEFDHYKKPVSINNRIPYVSVLQGTHAKMPNEHSNGFTKQFIKNSGKFVPVIDKIRSILKITDTSEYRLFCYKRLNYDNKNTKKRIVWVVDLSWYNVDKVDGYLTFIELCNKKFGNPW